MKAKITKKLTIDLTLDSSEAIMFTQGGKHKMFLKKLDDDDDDDPYHNYNMNDYDEVEISIQMERNSQGRFDFITKTAEKQKMYDNEDKQT